MQTSFYTFTTSNNPLLGDVTIGSYHSLNNKKKKTTNNKYPNHHNTIKSPLSTKVVSNLSLQPVISTSSPTSSKKNNRFSFQTQSSQSEEEIKTPITPKSLQHHVFDINHDETYKPSILYQPSSNHSPSLIHNIQQLKQKKEKEVEKEEKKGNGHDRKSEIILCDKKNEEKSILNNADDFEMIRSKITGITRAMQAFHVQELLFYHEPPDNNNNNNSNKNKHKNYHLTPDQPMCNPLWKDQKSKKTQLYLHQKQQIKKQIIKKKEDDDEVIIKNKIEPSFNELVQSQHHSITTNTTTNNNHHDEIILNNTQTTLLSTQLTDREASDIYSMYNQQQQHSYPAITPTTSTTLDQDTHLPPPPTYMLTPQQSTSSSTNISTISFKNENNDEEDEDEENEEMDEQWQNQFLSLMGNIVKQSEQLEWLSTDLLRAESHVRQLLSIASTVQDQFEEREKQYEERLKEVHVAGQQQLMMIDAIEDLAEDMDMKINHPKKENDTLSLSSSSTTPLSISSSSSFQSNSPLSISLASPTPLLEQYKQIQENRQRRQQKKKETLYHRKVEERHQKNRSSSSLNWFKQVLPIVQQPFSLIETESFVIKTRWYAGMILGSDVGKGDLIHVLSSSHHQGIEVVVSGFGIIIDHHDNNQLLIDQRSSSSNKTTMTINQPPKMMIHQYLLHLSPKDRLHHFSLLPKDKWVPDILVDECQLEECSIQFSLFQRKHHCRRCGKIICQQHSGNRLPLFKQDKIIEGKGNWYRICDLCFLQSISI